MGYILTKSTISHILDTLLRNGFIFEELKQPLKVGDPRTLNLNIGQSNLGTVTIKHNENGIKKEFKYDLQKLNELSSKKGSKTIEVRKIRTDIYELQNDLTLRQWLNHPYSFHKIRMELCDLDYPIYVLNDSRIGFKVLDGYHRIAKAILLNKETLKCIEFSSLEEIEQAMI